MKRTLILALAAALTVSLVTPVVAQQPPRTLHRAGAWSSFVATTPDGSMVCGIDIVGDGGQSFAIKRFNTNDHLTIHAFKTSWDIPNGTQVRAVISIHNQAWEGNGIAMQRRGIEWSIRGNAVLNFLMALRNGTMLTLTFAQGNETPWYVSLRGTAVILQSFAGCMQAQNDRLGEPRPGASQPFSRNGTPPTSPIPATPGPTFTGPERRT